MRPAGQSLRNSGDLEPDIGGETTNSEIQREGRGFVRQSTNYQGGRVLGADAEQTRRARGCFCQLLPIVRAARVHPECKLTTTIGNSRNVNEKAFPGMQNLVGSVDIKHRW
jgi:hypothetical protein